MGAACSVGLSSCWSVVGTDSPPGTPATLVSCTLLASLLVGLIASRTGVGGAVPATPAAGVVVAVVTVMVTRPLVSDFGGSLTSDIVWHHLIASMAGGFVGLVCSGPAGLAAWGAQRVTALPGRTAGAASPLLAAMASVALAAAWAARGLGGQHLPSSGVWAALLACAVACAATAVRDIALAVRIGRFAVDRSGRYTFARAGHDADRTGLPAVVSLLGPARLDTVVLEHAWHGDGVYRATRASRSRVLLPGNPGRVSRQLAAGALVMAVVAFALVLTARSGTPSPRTVVPDAPLRTQFSHE